MAGWLDGRHSRRLVGRRRPVFAGKHGKPAWFSLTPRPASAAAQAGIDLSWRHAYRWRSGAASRRWLAVRVRREAMWTTQAGKHEQDRQKPILCRRTREEKGWRAGEVTGRAGWPAIPVLVASGYWINCLSAVEGWNCPESMSYFLRSLPPARLEAAPVLAAGCPGTSIEIVPEAAAGGSVTFLTRCQLSLPRHQRPLCLRPPQRFHDERGHAPLHPTAFWVHLGKVRLSRHKHWRKDLAGASAGPMRLDVDLSPMKHLF